MLCFYKKFSLLEINLFLSYLLTCIVLAIKPYYFYTWLVENITVWLVALLIIYLRIKHYRFSSISIWVFFIAACLHTIGGHFSFQLVPGGKYLFFLGSAERNNFDHLGHFFCGMLCYPILEFCFYKRIIPSMAGASILCFMGTMGVAACYELFEWLDVLIAEAKFGEIFLGCQGDVWDAQADMFMCMLGAFCSVVIFLIQQYRYKFRKAKSVPRMP